MEYLCNAHSQPTSRSCKVDNTFIEKVQPAISLPDDFHWKLLSAYVQDLKGYLPDEDVTTLHRIIRSRDFISYLDLSEAWGLKSINSHGAIANYPVWKARYHIASLLSKYDLDIEGLDKQKAALEKFYKAEKACKFFNAFTQPIETGFTEEYRELLAHAKGFLKKLLTEKVPLRAVFKNAHHGPGANLDTLDGMVDTYFKYRNYPYSCTMEAASYARFMIQTDARWYTSLSDDYRKRTGCCPKDDPIKFWETVLKIVDHNKITFVPKSAKTLRSIALEPTLNVMLQLGVDSVIKNRLKAQFNIDLSDQKTNQLLSKVASIEGNHATIDLSAASDTIALKVCKLLLPDEWYDLLIKLRSPRGRLGKDFIDYHKISSMGNGFTFALESAIFAAIVYASGKLDGTPISFGKNERTGELGNANVYGDDIVIPSSMSRTLTFALNAFGFKINHDKTFVNGRIRESCGTDWWFGKPIRPIFLKTTPLDVQALYVIINKMQRHLELSWGITSSESVKLLKGWLPRGVHFYGPYSDEVFDSWLHSSNPQYENYYNGVFTFSRLLKRCETLHWPAATSDLPFRKLKATLRPQEKTHKFNKRINTMGQFMIDSKGFVIERRFVVQSFWTTHYTSLV